MFLGSASSINGSSDLTRAIGNREFTLRNLDTVCIDAKLSVATHDDASVSVFRSIYLRVGATYSRPYALITNDFQSWPGSRTDRQPHHPSPACLGRSTFVSRFLSLLACGILANLCQRLYPRDRKKLSPM